MATFVSGPKLTKSLWHHGLPITLSVPFWENSSFRGKLWRHFVGIRVMAIQPFVFWGGVHQKGLISRASYSSLGSKASDVFAFTNLLLVTLAERGSSLPVMRSELYTAKTDWWGWWTPESIWFVPLCTLSLAGNLNFLVCICVFLTGLADVMNTQRLDK